MAQKKIMRHASALKAKRQSRAQREINVSIRSKVRTLTKKTLKAVEEKNKDLALSSFKLAQSALQKASKTNVVHKNAAARQISRMASRVASLG